MPPVNIAPENYLDKVEEAKRSLNNSNNHLKDNVSTPKSAGRVDSNNNVNKANINPSNLKRKNEKQCCILI